MTTDMATPHGQLRQGRASLALAAAALLAAAVVALGTVLFLSRDLPEQTGETLTFPVSGLRFVFGSGAVSDDLMQVKEFADGYALLSSGPLKLQADSFRVLRYTWLPQQVNRETAFFWRRADDPENVSRTDITIPGTQIVDLRNDPDWSGEILEIGFLVAGENSKPVAIGESVLLPDSLGTRLQLTWKAWSGFEAWSQRSINFLYGGAYPQPVFLTPLVAACLCITLTIVAFLPGMGINTGSRRMFLTAGSLFLIAWMLLDVRWTANNIRQARVALETRLHADEQQRLDSGLDGEIYQHVQKFKALAQGKEFARVLIIGDDNIVDYYLYRAKYHLLPYSARVARRFSRKLPPEALDFVIFFGDPANLVNVPGWKRSWQNSLINIDTEDWGMVFQVQKR